MLQPNLFVTINQDHIELESGKTHMKNNAAIRLQATAKKTAKKMNSKSIHATELPKFRYIDDALRFLDKLNKEVDDLGKMVTVQQKALAFLTRPKDNVRAALTKAATFEFNIGEDYEGKNKRNLKRNIATDIPKIIVPNIDKLKNQYGLSEDLYEKYRLLESMETQLAMQFPDRRGEAYETAISSLRALKDKVAGHLKKVLAFLNEIAAKHIPRSFEKYISAITMEVEENVQFESSNTFIYMSVTPDGELSFTAYLMLVGAINDEGKITPQLYISIQLIVGGPVYIQLNHEYELPNQLFREGGVEVDSVGGAVKAISHLLDLEDFATSMGTVPLVTQLKMDPSKISENMFTFKDFISKLEVSPEKLTFQLRPGIEKDQLHDLSYALYPQVKELFKNTRGTKLKMEVSLTHIDFYVNTVAQKGEVTYDDAEFLKDRFGASDAVLRKVVNILNTSVMGK